MPGIISALKGVISGKGPELVKAVGDGLDNLFTSKEERAILDNKRLEIENLLKEKVMAHDERLAELAIRETEVYLADTQDARMNNTKVQESDKASWLAKNVAFCIDIFVILIWGIMTIYIIGKFLNIIKSQQGVDFSGVLGLYAGVTAIATQIIGYHRGSSKGSDDKQKHINKIMDKY
jgi:hypothetical protein